jgi:hypothetical protein
MQTEITPGGHPPGGILISEGLAHPMFAVRQAVRHAGSGAMFVSGRAI